MLTKPTDDKKGEKEEEEEDDDDPFLCAALGKARWLHHLRELASSPSDGDKAKSAGGKAGTSNGIEGGMEAKGAAAVVRALREMMSSLPDSKGDAE